MRRLWQAVGIDRAIGYMLLASALARLAGPIQLLFIASQLSEAEQGVYYSFANLIGLQVFLELGLSTVLTQVVSHERAGLSWSDSQELIGDERSKARIAGLLRLGLIWYGTAAFLLALGLLPAGWYFFATSPGSEGIHWQGPWIWLVIGAAASTLALPLQVVLTGCGLVAEAAKLQLVNCLVSYLSAWLVFSLGGKLYASPASMSVGLIAILAGIFAPGRMRSCLLDLLRTSVPHGVISYWHEVWPFQWRIALSWLAGYFIFQLFVPVLFRYQSPAVAGQMGMSLSVLSTVSLTAMSWVNTKLPEAGRLIALRDFQALDQLFRPAAVRCVIFVILAAIGLVSLVALLQAIGQWPGHRFLEWHWLGLLALTTIINQIVFAEAAYLRAHKREPFLVLSLVTGALVGASTWFLGRAYSAPGMILGYFLISLFVGLGGGTCIFLKKRRLWHAECQI